MVRAAGMASFVSQPLSRIREVQNGEAAVKQAKMLISGDEAEQETSFTLGSGLKTEV